MQKIIKILAATLCCGIIFASCANKGDGAKAEAPKERTAVKSSVLQFKGPQKGDTIATISTSMGDIKAILYKDRAPQAVENFVGLANEGYFNGVIFHRVVKDFVIQSGDDTGTGTGGKTIWNSNPFAVEVAADLQHYSGALSMARAAGDLNSNRSQFFVVQTPQDSINKDMQQKLQDAGYPQEIIDTYKAAGGAPSLDGQYTVFGQVYEGMDVVDKIGYAKVSSEKPVEDIKINSVTVSEYSE